MKSVIVLVLTLLPFLSYGEASSQQERFLFIQKKTLSHIEVARFVTSFNRSELAISIVDFNLDPNNINRLQVTYSDGQKASVFFTNSGEVHMGEQLWHVGPAVAGIIEIPEESSFLGIPTTSLKKYWMSYSLDRRDIITIGSEYNPAP